MAGFFTVGSSPVGSAPAGASGYYSITTQAVQYSGNPFTATYIFPQTRVSWIGAEVLHVGVSAGRVSWMGAEVLHAGDVSARVSWFGVEVLRSIATGGGDSGFVSILW